MPRRTQLKYLVRHGLLSIVGALMRSANEFAHLSPTSSPMTPRGHGASCADRIECSSWAAAGSSARGRTRGEYAWVLLGTREQQLLIVADTGKEQASPCRKCQPRTNEVLFVLISPRGSQVLHGMRKKATMLCNRRRVASVEPTPAHRAPDEMVTVVHLL
jgi:hypothetical protein